MIRQSKATKENLLTGDKVEVVKEKPIGEVRAVHTIELMDEKGEVIERTRSENFISIAMEHIQQNIAKFAFGAKGFSKDGYSDYTLERIGGFSGTGMENIATLIGDNLYEGNSPLNYLLLTNYDGPERPESELILHGKVIGEAERNVAYSGSNNIRGSFNEAESFLKKGQMHYVFDFPTHAANGQFNSIYWNKEPLNHWLNLASLGQKDFVITPRDGYANIRGCLVKGSRMYVIADKVSDGPGVIALLEYLISGDVQNITFNREVLKTSDTSQAPFNYLAENFDIDSQERLWHVTNNGILVIWGKDGTAQTIPGTSQKMLDMKLQGATSFLRGFCIVNDSLLIDTSMGNYSNFNVFISEYQLTDMTKPIRRIDTGKPWGSQNAYSSVRLNFEPASNQILFQPGKSDTAYFLSRTTLQEEKNTLTRFEPYVAGNYHGILNKNNRYFCIHAVVRNGVVLNYVITPLGAIGSRNLLPSPVNKTSTNTMKVTYDLFIDNLYDRERALGEEEII